MVNMLIVKRIFVKLCKLLLNEIEVCCEWLLNKYLGYLLLNMIILSFVVVYFLNMCFIVLYD